MRDNQYDFLPPGQTYPSEHTTTFAARTLPEMQAMVEYADPEHIRGVGDGFAAVRRVWVEGADGGALGELADIVGTVTRHWEGDAADAFHREVTRLGQMIAEGAEHARYAAMAMWGGANALQEYKTHIDAMAAGDPDDGGLRLDVDPKSTVNAETLLHRHRGRLAAAEERRLEAAVVMQQLGAAYNSQTAAVRSWRRDSPAGAEFPGLPEGTAPLEEVLPIAYQVSSPHNGPPAARRPRTATPGGPRTRVVLDTVSGRLCTVTDQHPAPAATAPGPYGGASVPGVVGGIPQQGPPPLRGRRSLPQRGVIGAADAAQPGGARRQVGAGLHARRSGRHRP
jgi:hypothetical protein